MSTYPEVQESNSLNLSWPQSVQYHIDEIPPAVSSVNGSQAAAPANTDIRTPITTYNGVPRELLRKAQIVIGDEIRVLDLRRGTREDPLVGSLRKVRLSDPIVYEPLSYTWTDYDDSTISDNEAEFEAIQTIFLENADTFVNIGTNCEKALRSIRKTTTDRRIWVDAICVNQDDPEERSRQVDLMRKIFARAFTVLVYLGKESTEDDSRMAMSLLGQPDRLRDFDGLDGHERSSLTHLFARPYFRRMWIVQEVALAPTLELHCGAATTYLSAFAEKPLEAIFGSGIAHPPWLKHSKYTAGSNQTTDATIGLSRAQHVLRLLCDTVSCSCKDDRDRVFALLSLLHSSEEEWLKADYNLSTTQVYTGIAAFLATNGLAWATLMLAARLAVDGHSDLPSWVPNWKVLSNAGLEDPELLNHMITRSQRFTLVGVPGVTRSGAITVRGKTIGPITPSDCKLSYMDDKRDGARQRHQDQIEFLYGNSDPGASGQCFTSQFTWTLTKPAQSPFDESWECHIESGLQYKPPSNAQYLAVMVEEESSYNATVLILRQDHGSPNQYKLVEIGMPLVWGVIPRDRAWDDDGRWIEVPLHRLSIYTADECRLHDVPLPPEQLPRLWRFPHLWGYNPATSAMSLKNKAVEKILFTPLKVLDLWLEWERQAPACVRTLSDETRLRSLIVEIDDVGQEDYKKIEVEAGLGPSWSLDHFLSLFVKDPRKIGPVEWPDAKMDGDQSYKETPALPVLMRWAAVTYRLLLSLRPLANENTSWLVPDLKEVNEIEDPFPYAMSVAHSQQFSAPSFTNGRETRDSERAAFLLRKISQQISGSMEPLPQERRSSSVTRLYWDWRKFESSLEEGFSMLRDVRPDIDTIRSCLKTPTPDVYHADAYELIRAHGVDLKKEYTEFRVK